MHTRLWIALVMCSATGWNGLAMADEKPLELYEQKIKAGLVYNLLKYTSWPKDSAGQSLKVLRLCLYGEDVFDGYLAPLEGRTAQQASIVISHPHQMRELQNCSAVILHGDSASGMPSILDFLQNKPILTISDVAHFAQEGGMVEMAREDEKVVLYTNKDLVERTGLIIDERMLKLSKIVKNAKVAGEAGGLR